MIHCHTLLHYLVASDPMISIGFENTAYTFSESGNESNPQVCVTVSEASGGVTVVVAVTFNQNTSAQGMS